MIKILKNKKGEIYFLTCVIILITILLSSLVYSFMSLNFQIENTKRNIEINLENYLSKKAIAIFPQLKEGLSFKDNIKDIDFESDAYEYINFTLPDNVKLDNIQISQDLSSSISLNFSCNILVSQNIFDIKFTYTTKLETVVSYIPKID